MPLPEDLVETLVCPKSKQPVIYFPRGEADQSEADGFLVCPASRLRYRIDDGVAVMLVDEALEVPQEALGPLVERARALGLRVP